MTDRTDGHRILERIAYRAWPSEETVAYDGWILRTCNGYTKRANSVNPHFGSTLALDEKIAHCETFYAERGLPPIFRLAPFSQPEKLDSVLAAAGYTTLDPTLVMTSVLGRTPEDDDTGVRLTAPAEWLSAFEHLRGLPAKQRVPHRRIVEAAEGRRLFALVEEGGAPIACGLGILIENVVGLFDLFTAESHRRRGHGQAIVQAILRAAKTAGARQSFLQVHSKNEAAHRLYARFGFEIAYPYWYRIAPESRRNKNPGSTAQ